eukprot:11430935-Alexandrium_andersonii.AAC.1
MSPAGTDGEGAAAGTGSPRERSGGCQRGHPWIAQRRPFAQGRCAMARERNKPSAEPGCTLAQ